MLTKPRWLLHREGAAILWLAFYSYYFRHLSWWLFALLTLAPDLFLLGYLKDAKLGSAAYNFVHPLTVPVLPLAFAFLLPAYQCFPYAPIWMAHIGFVRMLGYGPKYPTFFKDTHLQHV